MAEYTSTATQTVAIGQNVLFTERSSGNRNCNIMHREGSGIEPRGLSVTLPMYRHILCRRRYIRSVNPTR